MLWADWLDILEGTFTREDMYELGCIPPHLHQTCPQYSPAIMQSCAGWGGGAGRHPCLAPQCPGTMVPHAVSKAQPFLCLAPSHGCGALADISIFLM